MHVSIAGSEGSTATVDQLHAHRQKLVSLAAEHGLTDLRVQPAGGLSAMAESGRSYFDVVRFEQAATTEVGAPVHVDVPPAEQSFDVGSLEPL
jgi:hypothetical protein